MCNLATFLLSQCRIHAILHARETMRAIVFVRSFLCGSRTAQVSNFYCYFSHIYVFTAISMICDICSGVISSLICICNVAISTVLLYCIVTLVRLSLVTNKGYILTYLLTYLDLLVTRHTLPENFLKIRQILAVILLTKQTNRQINVG